jgi:superfamily II DNA or RNA helicase
MPPVALGQILTGAQFAEPVRVETIKQVSTGAWEIGVSGLNSQKFRKVTLSTDDFKGISASTPTSAYTSKGEFVRLGVQAYALGIAYEFDPYFALSISRVDPLPHQLEAVYDYLLKLPRVRFLLADDAGAGKTVMAGLLLKELKLRGLVERVLIVCPSNLSFQWQRELQEKFDEKFFVLKGEAIRDQFGLNQWQQNSRVITSLDLAKRKDILPGLRQAHWDLVIIDEAHRMSASPDSKTERYQLGELLRDSSDHILLLTATPHRGDPANFTMFLQLLDQDAYADVVSIKEAMRNQRAPFYLRRTKEAMHYFPEKQPDGTWDAKKIFTKRIPKTVSFAIDGEEDELYRSITRFVQRQSQAAAARGDDPRARAVGFLMALYQRRLASSAYSLRHSLENRVRRLEQALQRAQNLAQFAPPNLPTPDELEEMDDEDRERLEEMLDAVTLSSNAEQARKEIVELKELADEAKGVEDRDAEAKLAKLKVILQSEGFFERPDQRLLIFTEFRDTLQYLVDKLRGWGFSVGFIHGGMKPGSREEPNTRLHSEQQFRDGAIQILVATEAAGEGINLQVCHILFNYDIPWNPNRLEQRMGRIHRYGQTKDCLIFNFVASNTIEGRVLTKLLEKLQEIRDALDDDGVFNVVGEVLPAANVESILRQYYAGTLGAADLEERVLRDVQEDKFRAICQHALEGLASKKINLAMLVERRAKAQERRLVPETSARFLADSADLANLTLKPIAKEPYSFEPGSTPLVLKNYERSPRWSHGALINRYPRLSTDRETADRTKFEWITPGHALFEALRRYAWDETREACANGACFAAHVELSLTELIGRADLQMARLTEDHDRGAEGAAGQLAMADQRHEELTQRRDRRREELKKQRALSIHDVERVATALVMPHPDRQSPQVSRLRPDPETEQIAMDTAMAYERAAGRHVTDVHTQNLGYDLTSVDQSTGELRLIEVKGLSAAASEGSVMLTPNEVRVAKDRRDCFWLYVVSDCKVAPMLQTIFDPARFQWEEVLKVAHYALPVRAIASGDQRS